MSETIQVQMLGEFTIRYGDCVISDSNDRSHRVWSLLAYLLVNRSREFTQEELINLCWSGGTGSSDPANALKSVFHRIRALLDRLEDARRSWPRCAGRPLRSSRTKRNFTSI